MIAERRGDPSEYVQYLPNALEAQLQDHRHDVRPLWGNETTQRVA